MEILRKQIDLSKHDYKREEKQIKHQKDRIFDHEMQIDKYLR